MISNPGTSSEENHSPRRFFRWRTVILLLLVVLISESAQSWHQNKKRELFILRLKSLTQPQIKTERIPRLKLPSFVKTTMPDWFYRDVIRGISISYHPNLNGKLEGIELLDDLRYLNLHRCRYADAGIAPLAKLTNLEELHLDDSWISDAGMAHLRGLTNLKILTLSDTQISDEGLVHLKNLKKLQLLSLRDTYITGPGLVHLTGLKRLQILNLDGNNLTDAGFIHWKDLKELTAHNRKISPLKGKDLFVKSRYSPSLEISISF